MYGTGKNASTILLIPVNRIAATKENTWKKYGRVAMVSTIAFLKTLHSFLNFNPAGFTKCHVETVLQWRDMQTWPKNMVLPEEREMGSSLLFFWLLLLFPPGESDM